MRPFTYARPGALNELFELLVAHGTSARMLAGGTDLLVRLRMGHARPKVVIDLKRVDDLASNILEVDGRLRVGARVVMTDVIADPRMRRHFPALVDAAGVVGSVQIRNRATLAGNICNASPAADTAPALIVYGAVVNVRGPAEQRHVPMEEFFSGPGQTVLSLNEIVESIDLPVPSISTGAAFGRVTRRYGVDLATINLCCLVDAHGRVRVACGAVARTPFLVSGLTPSRGLAIDDDALVANVVAHTNPISDVRASRDYRLAMVDVIARRSLAAARERLAHSRAERP